MEGWPPPAHPGYDAGKRALDIVVAVLGLGMLSPIWLLVGALVRATSPGPALHRGRVVGRRGREFTYYKFRSMRPGDSTSHEAWLGEYVKGEAAPTDGTGFKRVELDRVTPVGRVLRRFSVDEVPQLLNVLAGQMSVVGPRPPLVAEYRHYDESTSRRLAVLPGITGLYQVTARSRVPFSRMLEIDLDYIRRRSLALDVALMLRSIGAVLGGRGAG